jgi:hypothetical protein
MGVWIGGGGPDAELEEAAADVRGFDGAVTVFVRIAHVDQRQRLVGVNPRFSSCGSVRV